MPRPKKGHRLGSGPAHQRLMLGGLATSLFTHERLRTTEAKAKALRPVAEKLITFAKRGDVHARRQVMRLVSDRDVVHRLFADIGPRFEGRDGGYTRILKLGPRKGDGAPMAQIELVEQDEERRERAKAQARAASERALRKRRGPDEADFAELEDVEAPEAAAPEPEEAEEPKKRRRLRRRKTEDAGE